MKLTYPSPAKINHFLHIVGRRADGYHLLETAFQYLDFGDRLHFSLCENGEIRLTPNEQQGISLAHNLIYRAAKTLQSASQTRLGVEIHWEKQIPLGAGLGGASSNAATTLFALNQLWNLKWSQSQLLQAGLGLGADVPFFIFGHSAFATGIGEQLHSVSLTEAWMLVICPPCQVISAKIYAHAELTRNTPSLRIGPLNVAGSMARLDKALLGGKNDFESLVRKLYPEIEAAFQWLAQYGQPRLSGSGSSLFAFFPDRETAEQVAKALPSQFRGFVVRGVNHSPLLTSQCIGVSPSGKAQGFDPCIPRFES